MIIDSPIVSGSLISNGSVTITGSLNVTGPITGTLTGSVNTASFAATASSADNFTVRGTLTAQTIVAQTITSSILYSSGSNIFGNSLSNTQSMTGSVQITGSLTVTTTGTELQVGATGVTLGNALTDVHNVTGSLRVTGSGNHWIQGGNIGIGTTSPSARLDVVSTSTSTAGLVVRGGSSVGAASAASGQILIGQTSTYRGSVAYDDNTGYMYIDNLYDNANSNIYFRTRTLGTPVNAMTILGGGNVGIGETNPTSYKLQVKGGDGSGIQYEDTNAVRTLLGSYLSKGLIGTLTNHALGFWTNNSEKMILSTSGNLGLGVTPSAWSGGATGLQVQYATVEGRSAVPSFAEYAANSYTVSGVRYYIASDFATRYTQFQGQHIWFNAPSGTAGNTITFTQAMTLDASGRLLINRTSSTNNNYYLQVTQGISSSTSILAQGSLTGYSGAGIFMSYESYGGRIESYDYGTSAWKNIAIAPNGGNVGIGTTSPSYTLDVTGGGRYLKNGEALRLQSVDSNGNYITFHNGGGAYGYIGSNYHLLAAGSASDLGIRGEANIVFSSGGATERMRITSGGNVGLGVTPSAWAFFKAVQVNGGNSFVGYNNQAEIWSNSFYDGANKYYANGFATRYAAIDGRFEWYQAPSGTAGNAITFTQAMTLDASGRLGIGTATPNDKLEVNGAIFTTANTVLSTTKGAIFDFNDGQDAGRILTYKSTGSNLLFYTNASGGGLTERLRITSSGNVGIGTTSPGSRLTVNGSIESLIDNTTEGGQLILRAASGGTKRWNIDNYSTSSTLRFFTEDDSTGANGVVAMNITSGGNVGIGNTSPDRKLYVADTSNSQNTILAYNQGASFTGTAIEVITDRTSNSAFNLMNLKSSTTSMFLVRGDGNVGIGITSPAQLLDVRSANTSGATGATIRIGSQNHGNSGDEFANLEFYWGDPDAAEVKAKIYTKNTGNVGPGGGGAADLLFATTPAFGSSTERMRITSGGFTMSVRTASDADSKTAMNTLNATCGMIPIPSGTTLYLYNRDGGTNYRVLLTSSTYFTGQHGNKPVNSDLKTNIQNYIGLIVSSTGTYHSVNPITQEVTTGKDAIQISEALPEIKLTDKDQDKAVWGVVTNVKNDNYNTDGTIETDNNTEWGDRLGSDIIRINGLGEGAIWVTNINGNIENGDYICSSIIPGHGRKQNDDLLHNFTVAKATMDCNFDLNNDNLYICEEFEFEGQMYKKAFIGCTYHCS